MGPHPYLNHFGAFYNTVSEGAVSVCDSGASLIPVVYAVWRRESGRGPDPYLNSLCDSL